MKTSYHWRCFTMRQDDGAIMLVRRPAFGSMFPSFWDLPGGSLISRLESFDPVYELSNIGISSSDLKHRTIVAIPEKNDLNHQRLIVYAVTKHLTGIPRYEPDSRQSYAEIKWVNIEELLDSDLTAGIADAVKMLQEKIAA